MDMEVVVLNKKDKLEKQMQPHRNLESPYLHQTANWIFSFCSRVDIDQNNQKTKQVCDSYPKHLETENPQHYLGYYNHLYAPRNNDKGK